jgi:DNA repair protein SbcC/Rad50
MRPLRLLLDGFGCYRQATEADFSDVDFFALVGPTGSGKSTVIDGLCFALYGTVPRWGKENVIAQALAPAANACRVCLVFEAGGKRYGAVRALTRDRRGQVTTKEARLELLDPQVPADAPIEEILAASIDQIAEGPDLVKSQVEKILGLTYAHFTQSVLLPQGRFAEFLQAKAAERQDLLVELLAFGVYSTVGQRARERARLAAERMRNAQAAREELADATEEAETQAEARVQDLAGLAQTVEAQLQSLGQLKEHAERAAQQARDAREEASLLAAVQTPAKVAGLAQRIREADQLLAERRQRRDAADEAERQAQQARDALPDKTGMEIFRKTYEQKRELALQLTQQEQALAGRQAAQAKQAAALQVAERELQQARDDLAHAERSHAAAALAQELRIGENCPVCLQPVASLPHHPTPADLAEAKRAVGSAEQRWRREQAAHQKAASATAAASSAIEGTNKQMERSAATLAEAPSEADVATSLEASIKAEETFSQAQEAARTRQAELSAAETTRSSLNEEETQAKAELGRTRDSVVRLGAPPIEDTDLAAAWETLTSWADAQEAERTSRQPDLDTTATTLQQQVTHEESTLTALLTDHGITDVTDSARAAAAVATHRERAENRLSAVRENRKKAAKFDEQIGAHRQEEQVAAMLGNLLRATSFERWLCGEALDSLVAEASGTLMELSAGQYQLDRDDRNDLIVIDYQDAGARRPVHTLSGGETFQASLALALALSRQVIGLSAGMRDLNSMFLDEGFGTLDEDTLETVATTLERLASDSDRMIGIITHVPALAERVPVRFVVSRGGATSTLRKERVG